MLDPAVIESLRIPFPPERPMLVEEQVLRSAAAEQALRIGRRLADGFDAAADSWIATMERVRRSVEGAPIEGQSPDDLQLLSATIDDFETVAEMRAKHGARLQKRIAREVKTAFQTDPSLAAAHRAFGGRIVATEKRIVDALLDYALFLRAVRAEIDPAARGGRVFEATDDLARYLASVGAV
ncbi:hypothetical protein [Methylorubrum extorquens]|jgi:hypothetical protein|uniref:hypothetical protein n=1 Tax=Methylorubrum extorquens TaxID=408 RepID=UPI002237C742|nr:hypothetical protein [Methylorubrum extorquens]UYW26082.1 hypothetical protein OKC48_22855 [Methylorubrum extorquens]UYW34113.1 hypothetical protein OKB92_08565 [Methylorubrum extorquens]